MGSDVARDGMFLELWDRPANELALWAFFSDADGSFEVTRPPGSGSPGPATHESPP